MNRPGMNGYRTPASKKAKREEAKVSDEANDFHFVLIFRGSKGSPSWREPQP